MKTDRKVTLGLLVIVIAMVLGIAALSVLEVYPVDAGANMEVSKYSADFSVNNDTGYPPPEPDPCPESYPPPYITLYPAPNLCKYLPLLHYNFDDILLDEETP